MKDFCCYYDLKYVERNEIPIMEFLKAGYSIDIGPVPSRKDKVLRVYRKDRTGSKKELHKIIKEFVYNKTG